MVNEIARILDAEEILADPIKRLQVAQAAFAFLDIRLDEITAFALTEVAGIAFSELGLHEIPTVAGSDLGPEFLLEFVVKRAVAPEEARFQKRRTDGDVLLGEAHAFRYRTRGVTDLESQVPQHVQDDFDNGLPPGCRLEGANEQEIDIGGGRE